MDQQHSKTHFLGVYDAHSNEIFRFCSMKVSDSERAQDITQEVFMRYWQSLGKGEDITNERAYLYRVARNLVIDWYRKKKESSLDVMMEAGADFAGSSREEVTAPAEVSEVLKVMQELDAESHEVLLLRYVEGYSPKEIATILKVSPNVVSVRIHRALKKVQEKLHTDHD